MFKNEPYLGFTFDGHHSSEFGLLVVSDGSRYHQPLSANFSDETSTVAGYNGLYYFGTQFSSMSFDIECAFDEMTTQNRNKIQNWLYPNKIGWLIFDETPYKKYRVKVDSNLSLKFMPFGNNNQIGKFNFKQDILKGELSISFKSLEEYAHINEKYLSVSHGGTREKTTTNNVETITTVTTDIENWVLESGLLPKKYTHDNILLPYETMEEIESYASFGIYNAGNGVSNADFSFSVSTDIFNGDDYIEINNLCNNENYIINNFTELFTSDKYLTNSNSTLYTSTDINYYRISILGAKKEIWGMGFQSSTTDNDIQITQLINLGSAYNHYYPKVCHDKAMEIAVVGQNKIPYTTTTYIDRYTLYPYLYKDDITYRPSDQEEVDLFEPFWKDLEGYTFCSLEHSCKIKEISNPSEIKMEIGNNEWDDFIANETVVYFIKPNEYRCNKTLYNFTPEYDYTYI